MKHFIIYHSHCLDGFGAAWAVATSVAISMEGYELFPASYGNPPPLDKVNKETIVHIVDFSYPPKELSQICNKAEFVYVHDHHQSAIDKFEGVWTTATQPENLHLNLNNKKSGAMLAWDYYRAGEDYVPRLIQYIQDRDLWKFELPGTKAINLNLQTQEQTIQRWDELAFSMQSEDGLYIIIKEGEAIDRYYQKTIKSIIAQTKRGVSIDGIWGLGCNTNGMFASDIGHILATESGTFGMTHDLLSNNSVKFSLRSNGDFDVAKIAESFGGGGHKNAAGFVVAKEHLVNILSGRIL